LRHRHRRKATWMTLPSCCLLSLFILFRCKSSSLLFVLLLWTGWETRRPEKWDQTGMRFSAPSAASIKTLQFFFWFTWRSRSAARWKAGLRWQETFNLLSSWWLWELVEGRRLYFGNIQAVAGRDFVYVLDAHSQIARSFSIDLAVLFQSDATGGPPKLIFLEAVLRDTVDADKVRQMSILPQLSNNHGKKVLVIFIPSPRKKRLPATVMDFVG
jgi:hypothetical protein